MRWTWLADRQHVRRLFVAAPVEMLSTIQYCEGWTWLLLVPMLEVPWMVQVSKKYTGGVMLTLPHVAAPEQSALDLAWLVQKLHSLVDTVCCNWHH